MIMIFFKKTTRRRWNRTTGTLIPHGFEVQALNPQSSSTQNAGCEDRTHDLWIMRPTLYQLSQPSFPMMAQKKTSKKSV
jgi:hypothetical protein